MLKELDLTKDRFLDLVSQARGVKRAKASGTEQPLLTGMNIALVFEKSSTRTRCAFEVAAHDQGAHVTCLDPTGSHMGREESVPDTAKVLGRMFDAIVLRGFAQDTIEEPADHRVPVVSPLPVRLGGQVSSALDLGARRRHGARCAAGGRGSESLAGAQARADFTAALTGRRVLTCG